MTKGDASAGGAPLPSGAQPSGVPEQEVEVNNLTEGERDGGEELKGPESAEKSDADQGGEKAAVKRVAFEQPLPPTKLRPSSGSSNPQRKVISQLKQADGQLLADFAVRSLKQMKDRQALEQSRKRVSEEKMKKAQAELEAVKAQLVMLKQKYEPLCKQLTLKKQKHASLKAALELGHRTAGEMGRDWKAKVRAVTKGMEKQDKAFARQQRVAARGFSTAPGSTFSQRAHAAQLPRAAELTEGDNKTRGTSTGAVGRRRLSSDSVWTKAKPPTVSGSIEATTFQSILP